MVLSERNDCCKTKRPRGRLKGKCLLGVLCILAGILVLICCVPSWLVAIIAAFLLFSLGAALIGLT